MIAVTPSGLSEAVPPHLLVRRALVVEPDALARDRAVESLASVAQAIDTTGACSEALTTFEGHHHELVVVDEELPDGSGLELVKRIHERSPGTVCLLMVAPQNARQLAEESGERLFVKPLEHSGLRRAVRTALGAPNDEERGIEFGHYRLIKHVASGGMAEVHLAKRRSLGSASQRVAIKLMRPELGASPEYREMFFDEGRIAGSLSHPNVVEVLEMGEVEGRCFLALEYVDGVSLAQVLPKPGAPPLELPFVMAVMGQLLSALEYVHTATDHQRRPLLLVHRDVSPSNVMLTRSGHVKLVDFGVAKATSNQHQTGFGLVKGKVPYMSPEQVQSFPIDHRSDLFSAASVLMAMLTGEPPFVGRNELEVVIAVRDARARSLRALRPDLPKALDKVMRRALAPDPRDRYQSAEAFRQALFAACQGQPRPSSGIAAIVRVVTEQERPVGATLEAPTQPQLPAETGPAEVPEAGDTRADRPTGDRRESTALRTAGLVALGMVAGALLTAAFLPSRDREPKLEVRASRPLPPPSSDRLAPGHVQVEVPGLQVWVDQRPQGLSPLAVSLRSGLHSITLVDTSTGGARTIDLHVEAGVLHRVPPPDP